MVMKKRFKEGVVFLQIALLVIGIVAISYSIGSVSADEEYPQDRDGNPIEKESRPSISNIPVPVAAADEVIDVDGLIKEGFEKIVKTEKVPVTATKFGLGHLFKNGLTALTIYATLRFVGDLIFPEEEDGVKAAAAAISAGYFAGDLVADFVVSSKGPTILGEGAAKFLGGKFLGLAGSTWIGLGVAVIIFAATFSKKDQQQVNFMCVPWQAPMGGSKCEECGSDGLPCTEYQCRSLGQGCELVNPGTSEQGCVWLSRNDVKPPVIQPWVEALINSTYTYNPDSSISPPDRGVFIRYSHGCIPAFTPFRFGITSDERASCKVDSRRKSNISEMDWFFGGSNFFTYNHTQSIVLPSQESLETENITLENDGNFELYVRCQDVNGNVNTANFVFKYCVNKGPDTTPPIIIGTNFDALPEVPIAFNQTELDIELYTNEPAECRWSHDRDLDFSQMPGNMTCPVSVFEYTNQLVYRCVGTLDGLKSRQKNDFYFRCKDKPKAKEEDRNVNTKGFKFTVAGTQPLVIDEAGPNGIIRDSTTVAKIILTAETSAGYNEGVSACYFSETGQEDSFVKFGETDSYTHKQELYLGTGEYNYIVKCLDLGGNEDRAEINFAVETDSQEPEIVRAYHADGDLVVATDEPGECVYSLQGCSYLFGDGVGMSSPDNLEHYAEWNTQRTYYVKCQDNYGNQPDPNQCSIVVRAFEFFEGD